MKIGYKNLGLLVPLMLGIYLGNKKSKKTLDEKNVIPTVNQYVNRLKEFYVSESLAEVIEEYLRLVNSGISPRGAFDMLTFTGELN